MGRKPRGSPVHGWVILDKPGGVTSAHAVARVRRLFDAAKAGHAGTLDPLATGVLPIALGEATKTVPYLVDGSKTYRFTARWGEARDTDDAEGAVTAESAVRPSVEAIAAAAAAFVGVVCQVPPRYSAIKVSGRRSYDLARERVEVALAPREVTIDRVTLVAAPDRDHAVLEVRCGKGTYVRSLARDLAARLGTVGHVSALRRLAVGPFCEDRAISLDKLEALGHSAPRHEHLLPVVTALDDIPALALTEAQADYLRHGRAVRLMDAVPTPANEGTAAAGRGGLYCAMAKGRPVALARVTGNELRPVRVLNL
jgi:tRNA pseudouridine55 synthase